MYQWFVFAHLVGLVLFAFAHGGSAFVALRLPGQRDRALVASYLETSQLATRTMYIGLLLLLIGGAGAATINDFWTKPWVLGSIVVLLVVIVLMYALGTRLLHAAAAAARRHGRRSPDDAMRSSPRVWTSDDPACSRASAASVCC